MEIDVPIAFMVGCAVGLLIAFVLYNTVGPGNWEL